MANKNYKKKTEYMTEAQKLKRRINELNNFIVDLEFDNRQLRMEITFLYSKLEQKVPTAEEYEIPF
jgi:predicted  nucleic acid-binding Zn-ribbon protein